MNGRTCKLNRLESTLLTHGNGKKGLQLFCVLVRFLIVIPSQSKRTRPRNSIHRRIFS
uniref:Uncharacterized protein n=1 Tax=Anopheles arabiensis TaxID=7173 RepID=A0A182IGF4_ANOAR